MITFLAVILICSSGIGLVIWLVVVGLDGYNRRPHSLGLLIILIIVILGLICVSLHNIEVNKIKYYRVYNIKPITCSCSKYEVTLFKKMPKYYSNIETTFKTNAEYKLGQRVYKVPTGE